MTLQPGQIWDRTHRSGVKQIGIILRVDRETCYVYVMDGGKAGEHSDWKIRALDEAVREGRMVQLA